MSLCRLVKSGVGKTWAAAEKMRRNEVGKESLKDMFLPVFKEKTFQNGEETKHCFVKFNYYV